MNAFFESMYTLFKSFKKQNIVCLQLKNIFMFNLLSKILVNKFSTFAYFNSFQMSSRHDLRILYVYKFKLGQSAAQATRNINTAFGEGSWFAKFRFGDFDLRDEEGRGRNHSTDNEELRTLVCVFAYYCMVYVSLIRVIVVD